jgi:hypothetical protein
MAAFRQEGDILYLSERGFDPAFDALERASRSGCSRPCVEDEVERSTTSQ